MKRHHVFTAIVAVVAAAITFVVTDLFLPHEATAPGMELNENGTGNQAAAPVGSIIIPMNIVSIEEHASTSPTIAVEYPQFPSLPAAFNAEIASATLSRLADFKSLVAENDAARRATAVPGQPNPVLSPSSYSFLASWEPAQVNSRYVSFVERYDSFSGGANENQELQTFNFDVATGKEISLDDLFGATPDYLNQISTMARRQLTDSLSAASNGNVPTAMLEAGTAPSPENFSNFTFTDYAVTFYFPKYAVAPGSFGEQKASILRSSVK